MYKFIVFQDPTLANCSIENVLAMATAAACTIENDWIVVASLPDRLLAAQAYMLRCGFKLSNIYREVV